MQAPDVLGASKRWSLDGLDFTVETALGLPIRGRFDRVGGSYEVGPDGARIEFAVDPTSIVTGNGIWDGLLRPGNDPRLTKPPQLRFRSTRVSEMGNMTVHVEGILEAAGKVEPVAFEAAVDEVDDRLRLEAVVTVDRQRLGMSAARFAVFLPATVHITMHLGR